MNERPSIDQAAISYDGSRLSRRTLLTYGTAFALGAPIIAACSGSSPSTASASHVTKGLPGKGKVRWSYEAGFYQTSYQAVIAKLQKQHPGINVPLVTQVGPANDIPMINAIKAGVADLITTKNPKFQYLDPMLTGRQKLLVPLNDYYQAYGWNHYLTPFTTSQGTRDGKIYTVTFYLEGPGVAYRPSVLKRLGAQVPSTWAEFLDLLDRAKAAGKIPIAGGVQPLSFLVMIHNMIWASENPSSIADIIFGNGKWTDGPCAEAAQSCVELWNKGYIDHNAPSLSITQAQARFQAGQAVTNLTGTWAFASMQDAFKQDYGLFTAPSPNAAPRWSLGEDQAQSIPYNSTDPNTAAAVLDFCIRGTGAQVFAEHGNLMATKAALPFEQSQTKVVPITSPSIGLYLYGWLPVESQNAWMNGFTEMLQGKLTPSAWCQQIQAAWERDEQSGNLPSASTRAGTPH
jgi:raffinose/stachyose/melibiose transport system substrate-binding protein